LGSDRSHEPVLAAAIVELLRPQAGGVFVDCTVGSGGHTAALLSAGASRVIAIDRDASALDVARDRLAAVAGQVVLVHADYRRLGSVLAAEGTKDVTGIVADLGVSSMQLDDPARGFSFRVAGPLDMRADRSIGATLAERLATVDEAELTRVIAEYGEERHARGVARAILRARDERRLTDTAALASVVRRAAGRGKWSRIDPATRTFQGLRIWVNDELEGLAAFLIDALSALAPRGRCAVIAFHSLEDRVVKHTFREEAARGRVTLVTRRPLVPGDDEIARNPRARSARLRVAEKVA
jgi:16S rRNA (cytosine1402-N4)-methyltransferase